jgi:hypothetical protein
VKRALIAGLALLCLGCGEVREYHSNGQVWRIQHYDRQGHEAGLQTFWRPDGTLHSNYEVRHGRRYGLVNAKPCQVQ